jgi:tetratricopeptide (TPR) repeat protein
MTSPRVLTLVKQIVRQTAELGLDEAGTLICGPAWPPIKKILEPVMAELDRRFPNLTLANTEDAKEAAREAVRVLDNDRALQDLLDERFGRLDLQQKEVFALLARYDDKLNQIGGSIDRGFEATRQSNEAIADQLRQMNLSLDLAAKGGDISAGLTVDQIFEEAASCQVDALHQANAGNYSASARRLGRGRQLAEAGLRRAPEDTRLLSVLGFVEKTQAQIDQLTEPDRAASALSKAAEYFAHVLAAEPDNISALNGMANVYAIRKDYDRACKLGETLFTMAPEYGAAIFDYALALEGLMEERGEDTQLLEKLDKVYRHLQTLIMRPEQNFSAVDVAFFEEHAEIARKRLSMRAGGGC